MRRGVCGVAALLVLGVAAPVVAPAPASAADCIVPASSSTVVHHAHVHHRSHRLHRRRGHGHRHHLAAAKPAGGAGQVALQDRPLPVKAALTGNACAVHHHPVGGSEVALITPGTMIAGRSLFDVMAALDTAAPATFDEDLLGSNPVHADFAGVEDGLGSSGSGGSEPDLIGSGPGLPADGPIPGPIRQTTDTPPTSGNPGPPTTVVPPTPPITAAVPEPETWALMIIGLGFVGLAARRRDGEVQDEAPVEG